MTLEEVFNECKVGNKQAQGELYTRFHDLMMAASYKDCGDRDTACDMVQEGFLLIFDKINNLDVYNEAEFIQWMRNVIINRHKWDCIYDGTYKTVTVDFTEDAYMHPVFQETDEEEWSEEIGSTGITYDDIQWAIGKLPDGQADVYDLHLDNLKPKIIAQELGISYSCVTYRLFKSEKSVRRILANKEFYKKLDKIAYG